MPDRRSVTFFIPGVPTPKLRTISAVSKKKDGTSYIKHITPSKTVSYEKLVRHYASRAIKTPMAGPLEVRAVYHFAPPESASKKAKAAMYGQYKWNGYDIDNITKSVLDGMNRRPLKEGKKTIGWDLVAWTDDSQIARLLVAKKYIASETSPVGVSVTITELEGSPDAQIPLQGDDRGHALRRAAGPGSGTVVSVEVAGGRPEQGQGDQEGQPEDSAATGAD